MLVGEESEIGTHLKRSEAIRKVSANYCFVPIRLCYLATDLVLGEWAASRVSQTATEAEKNEMRLDLERVHGEVATLQARLDTLTLASGMGRDWPLPVVAIIAVSAVAVAVLVIVLLIVTRLVQ